ncbi:dTDP-4-dehydrorhamnose reductase [Mesonia aquimarina]|uniref:dTDP-4-dehydrorhamnose reductase n=1 Tax=Mesonia aquimarina TaxID=1504967 RepID=UPI000EF6334B|nr:dTDP-4-dehydrorhamnose reductase [Mesonia aquimarina]
MGTIEKQSVLVLGSGGQLGRCLQDVLKETTRFDYIFKTSREVDITDKAAVEACFAIYQPVYCINAAAYTAVDKAEEEKEQAYAVNKQGLANIAESCKKHKSICIHISTDFVFQGNRERPLGEEDEVQPINVYGASKLAGEEALKENWKKHIIIRTSWLFSEYETNFLKTMAKLAQQEKAINVVNDQIGTPTYAGDLAILIDKMITEPIPFGIYHFSNEGVASWYDFAYEVFKFYGKQDSLHPIPATEYPTAAKRPAFTVLNKQKLKQSIEIAIPHWKESVQKCLEKLKATK